MALEIHWLPFDNLNIDFGEVEKAIFQVVARHWEHIFFFLTTPICDLGEVEKAMFEGLLSHFELIFSLLNIPKCDLGEVDKAMFQGSHVTLNSFSASWPSQNATSLRSR